MTPMPPGDACGGGPRQTAHHSGPSLLYLTRTDLLSLGLEMTGIIDAVEAGIRGKGEGEAVMPPKLTLHGAGGAFSQAMAAALPQALGVKWVTIFPANAAAGLSVVNGLVIASDPATGLPVAVMDAGVVTAWRTGASVAVAARLLARRDVTGIGVLGCGTQARSSVAALAAVFPVSAPFAATTSSQPRRRRSSPMSERRCREWNSSCAPKLVRSPRAPASW